MNENQGFHTAGELEERYFSKYGTVDDIARNYGGLVDVLDHLRNTLLRQLCVFVDVFEIDGGIVEGGRQIAVKNMEHLELSLSVSLAK